MKKNYAALLSFIFLTVFLSSFQSTAQLVRLSQGFDNYIGSLATVPAGWYISWNSTSSPSYYITPGDYGAVIPSYKFGNNRDSIVSPYFLSGDTLKFWCKGQPTFSTQNTLSILYSADSTNWNILQNPDSLPVVDTTLAYPLPCEAHYLMFIYNKVSGNLAFDDALVTMTDYSPVAVAMTTLNLHCEGDSVCFFDISTMAGCDSIVSSIWDFGDSTAADTSQNTCHTFSQPGNYIVKLVVAASNGNSDSTTLNITVYPLPAALFSTVNVLGTTVDFTDLSSVLSGSIISWVWNFGDSTLSLQQNPSHPFPAIGTYYTCLTASSGFGCSATICDSVDVIGVGVEEHNIEFPEVSFYPNPAQNEITVRLTEGNKLSPQFELFDITGNKILISVERMKEKIFRIPLPAIADGVYFLKVVTDREPVTLKVLVAN